MSVKADLRVILGIDKAGFDRSLASATSSVNRFSRQTQMASKSVSGLLGGAGLGGITKLGSSVAIMASLGKAIGDVAANGRQLETSMSHLQSLTGLSNDVMGQVKQMATDTAMAMDISSSQIVDSYGVIGSKMPELLKSPEALDAIARSAATLAKAGVMPLEASIESLTGIMNQMGASAEEAEIYINVLAAGSKNGAGNIEYLATAFTKSGSAIRNAGLSVQEGTALIEALAKRMPDAAEAGTALRNVLLVLGTTAGDDLNPKVVGLDKALENLHARMGDTNEMVKLFGKRNYNAAAILADSTEQVKNLTEAVTGTSEAHLQAEVNGKTLDAQLNRLSSSWTTLTAAIGESNGFLQSFIGLINQALQGLALFMRNSAEARISDHATKANSRIKQRANDRLAHYQNDTDTSGKRRYNDKQARQQVINEMRNERKYEKEQADALARQINSLKTTHVQGWEGNVKRLSEELAMRNNNIRAYNKELERLQKGEPVAAAPVVTAPTGGGSKKTGKKGGAGRSSNTPSYTAGSLKDYEAQLSKLNATLQGNVDVTQLSEEQLAAYGEQFADLYRKIDAAKKALKQFENSTERLKKGTDSASLGKFGDLFGNKPTTTNKLSGVNIPDSPNAKLIKEQMYLNQEIERTSELYEGIGTAMGDMGNLTMQTFANIMNTISVFKSDVGDTKAQIGAMGAALSSAGQAVSAIGSAMEDKGMQIGGLIAQTIGNLALSFALAMKQAGQLSPIGWAAFGIAGLAQLIAMVAQIKSLTSGYASGGIIQGNSYHGDQMYVRANAGEMILTQGQQSRLFRMLDGGVGPNAGGQVEFVLQGSQLKGVLNNYNRKTRKLS
jgi:TP901 family phage tail tape measure protein